MITNSTFLVQLAQISIEFLKIICICLCCNIKIIHGSTWPLECWQDNPLIMVVNGEILRFQRPTKTTFLVQSGWNSIGFLRIGYICFYYNIKIILASTWPIECLQDNAFIMVVNGEFLRFQRPTKTTFLVQLGQIQ